MSRLMSKTSEYLHGVRQVGADQLDDFTLDAMMRADGLTKGQAARVQEYAAQINEDGRPVTIIEECATLVYIITGKR